MREFRGLHEENGDAVDEDLIHPHLSIMEANKGIATKDAENAESNSQLKKLYHSAKAEATWNKSSRSFQVAEAVLEICKQALVKPNQTRWNSWYMAIQRLVKINKDEPHALAILCKRIDLPRLVFCELFKHCIQFLYLE